MGKKGGWFSAVRKALIPQSKKEQKANYKKKWGEEDATLETTPSTEQVSCDGLPPPAPPLPPPLPNIVTKSTEVKVEEEQNKHAYSVALATAAAAKAALAAAQAAAEVVRLTTPRFFGRSKEETAATKIQTAFRGYLARRALRALRGLVRLKSLIESQSVKRQAGTTLRCMQTLARVQSQIRARRIRLSEENQALQRQLQQKHEKELEKLRMGETWDDSIQSKEQIEASLQNKQVAAMRRERALAYAFTHQKSRKNNKNSNQTFMDPNNPQWGWSWLERWMAARPWESKSFEEKESNDNGSLKSFRTLSVAGEINRAYALRDLNIDNNKPSTPTGQRSSRPSNRQSPSTTPRAQPLTRAQSLTPLSRKSRPASPKSNGPAQDEDTKSTQSQQFRRHSIAGTPSVKDEILVSAPSSPKYMSPTKSVKSRASKQPSPLGGPSSDQKPPFDGSTKKRLSFSASPRNPRRLSVPGKFESTPVKDAPVQIFVSN